MNRLPAHCRSLLLLHSAARSWIVRIRWVTWEAQIGRASLRPWPWPGFSCPIFILLLGWSPCPSTVSWFIACGSSHPSCLSMLSSQNVVAVSLTRNLSGKQNKDSHPLSPLSSDIGLDVPARAVRWKKGNKDLRCVCVCGGVLSKWGISCYWLCDWLDLYRLPPEVEISAHIRRQMTILSLRIKV